MSEYTPSIIHNYGDTLNVQKDIKVLRDILNRQGSHMFLEVLADNLAKTASNYHLSRQEIDIVVTGDANMYKGLVDERT